MRYLPLVVLVMFAGSVHAQASGNAAYGDAVRVRTPDGPPGTLTSRANDSTMVLHAYVLVNAPADRYVATFNVSESAPSLQVATAAVDAKIEAFRRAVGRRVSSFAVDPVTQIELFEYVFSGTAEARVAQEQSAGYEVQRSVIVSYRDLNQITALAVAASSAGIHDLAWVQSVTDDIAAVRADLFDAAARVIADKHARHAALGVPLSAAPVAAETERYESVAPPDRYVRYTAFEAASVDIERTNSRNRPGSLEIRRERKPPTLFWQPLDEGDFDRVIRPGPTEPLVQHTLRLTVRYGLR